VIFECCVVGCVVCWVVIFFYVVFLELFGDGVNFMVGVFLLGYVELFIVVGSCIWLSFFCVLDGIVSFGVCRFGVSNVCILEWVDGFNILKVMGRCEYFWCLVWDWCVNDVGVVFS